MVHVGTFWKQLAATAALTIASSPLCASLSAIPTAEREVLDCLPGHTFAAHQNWENTDDVTWLGTGMQVLTGVFNLDLLADIRDNWYNLTHWSDVSTAQKLIDLIGLLPAIGVVKYADEVGDVIKGGNRAADAASAAKRPVTTVLSDATVISHGKVVGKGDVYLKPTIESIESGALAPRRIFENREALLPPKPHGYYQEFVHPTPGVSGVGSQRIVRGAGGELYYTPDHYTTFVPLN